MKRIRIMGLCLVAVFAMSVAAASTASAAPDYGKCVKKAVSGGAGFSDAGCTKAVATKALYEWQKGGATGVTYTTNIKAGTLATLETVKKEKVVCKGETSTGTILSETTTETTPTFTGCEALKLKCSTPGEPEGTIAVSALEGELGIEKKGTTAATNKIASNLFRQGNRGGEIVEFTCGGFTIKVKGTVLFPVTANKMLTLATVKFTASKGLQKPEKFEGGAKETLSSSFGGGAFEQSGQTITTEQHNASAIEVNSVS
jgi:hypothetical protein